MTFSEPLLRSVPRTIIGISSRTILVVPQNGAPPIVAHPSVQVLLSHLDEFRTMSEHESILSKLLQGSRDSAVSAGAIMKQLLNDGLLLSRPVLSEALAAHHASSRHQSGITCTVIVTADRPAQLARCLTSLTYHLANRNRVSDILVIDYSKCKHCYTLNRKVIENVRPRRDKGTILHIYRDAVWELIAGLVSEGIPRTVCEYALAPRPNHFDAGSARNVALLLTKGQQIVMLDDDVEVVPVKPNGLTEALQITCKDVSYEVGVYPDRESLMDSVTPCDLDVLESAEKLLGENLSTLDQKWGGKSIFTGICDELVQSMLTGCGAVSAVMLGTYGDSGRHTGDWLHTQSTSIADALSASDKSQITAITSRNLVLIPNQYSISHAAPCVSMALALDNNDSLPPFAPQFRCEDGVFGLLMSVTGSPRYVGHAPVAVFHNATPAREYDTSQELRMSDILSEAINRASGVLGKQQSLNLGILGDILKSAVSSSKSEKLVRDLCASLYATRLRLVEQMEGRFSHASRIKRTVHERLSNNSFDQVTEVRSLKEDDRADAVREELLSFASLLSEWDKMLSFAHNNRPIIDQREAGK